VSVTDSPSRQEEVGDADLPPDDEAFMDLVRAVFTQRRKTMRNAVRNTGHISGIEDPEAVVEAADEELMSRRAGNVEPAEFARLARIAAEVDDQ
jgi:16S rRNA (adenine1518-N6/adenine1519-N6)-dimethyltransferase